MRVLVALVLVAVGLAGCSDSETPDDFTPWRVEHEAGTGSFFERVFRIEVDGDTEGLQWSLDADGDGTDDASGASFPGEATFTFPGPGVYQARATLIGGGGDRVLTTEVDLTELEPVVFEGTTSVISGPQKRDTGYLDCAGFQSGQNELDCIWFSVVDYQGWAFKVASDGPPGDVEFLTNCDARTAASISKHFDNASGTVPANAGCAVLWDYGSATATMKLTLTPA